MKIIHKLTTLALAVIMLLGCEESFLDRVPKDKLMVSSTFSSYENFRTYAWQFYAAFPAYDNLSVLTSERDADLGEYSTRNSESLWIWQKIDIPTNSNDYSIPFSNIRAINLMLENVDKGQMSETDKKHWRSIAYFFKAYNYAKLVNKYGDITWVENSLNEEDKETLFGPRTPRDEVAKKIFELLQFAEQNIKPDGDGPNTVNVHVVRALISQFGLEEGTWRKYHGLPDADIYLNACVAKSELLLTAFPNIMSNYGEVYTSASLAGKYGIILYKQYEKIELTHAFSGYVKNSSGHWDLTRKAIDMYLMKDGQTRWTSPLFAGDDSRYKEFRNRDTRLYLTTSPPYKINAVGLTKIFTHTTNPADKEYFAVMESLSPDGMKALPVRNWQSNVVPIIPHFFDNNRGQPFCITFTGYQLTKYYTRLNEGFDCRDISDAPIFRIEEVMLNYAEAKKELGGFDQTICDKTINKLRARGGVASLNLANIPNDPKRDPDVDPAMWEIRRERAIELMGEGFRFGDLRRWKKMDYATERKLGQWIVKSEEANRVPTLNNAAAGYVSYEGVPPTPFPEHYYLYPIPSNEIVLTNGIVKQNPGWQ